MEPDPATRQPAARAARLTADPGRFAPRVPWAQSEADPEWPLGAPWTLLLAFLNLERRVPPWDWPTHQEIDVFKPNRDDWKRFQRDAGAPYLLTRDQGHPLLWFPSADGEMYGFLFNFGLQLGQWHWSVPGTERVVRDPETGGTMIIMGERHPEEPDGKTIRELQTEAPPGLFDVDTTQFRTLKEALDGELRHHPGDERNRCRFFVYPAAAKGHGFGKPYGLQTLEAQRQGLAALARTWLSPHPALWNVFVTHDWRRELGGHANPEEGDRKTEDALAAIPAAERFRRTCAQAGGNPLQPLLDRLRPAPQAGYATSPRVLPALQVKASGGREAGAAGTSGLSAKGVEVGRRHREAQTAAAKRRLARASGVQEVLGTTDLFATVAQQIMWAVQVGVTVRACPHPGCGRAFVPESGKHRYCAEHRSGTARSQRTHSRRSREEG